VHFRQHDLQRQARETAPASQIQKAPAYSLKQGKRSKGIYEMAIDYLTQGAIGDQIYQPIPKNQFLIIQPKKAELWPIDINSYFCGFFVKFRSEL